MVAVLVSSSGCGCRVSIATFLTRRFFCGLDARGGASIRPTDRILVPHRRQ